MSWPHKSATLVCCLLFSPPIDPSLYTGTTSKSSEAKILLKSFEIWRIHLYIKLTVAPHLQGYLYSKEYGKAEKWPKTIQRFKSKNKIAKNLARTYVNLPLKREHSWFSSYWNLTQQTKNRITLYNRMKI